MCLRARLNNRLAHQIRKSSAKSQTRRFPSGGGGKWRQRAAWPAKRLFRRRNGPKCGQSSNRKRNTGDDEQLILAGPNGFSLFESAGHAPIGSSRASRIEREREAASNRPKQPANNWRLNRRPPHKQAPNWRRESGSSASKWRDASPFPGQTHRFRSKVYHFARLDCKVAAAKLVGLIWPPAALSGCQIATHEGPSAAAAYRSAWGASGAHKAPLSRRTIIETYPLHIYTRRVACLSSLSRLRTKLNRRPATRSKSSSLRHANGAHRRGEGCNYISLNSRQAARVCV